MRIMNHERFSRQWWKWCVLGAFVLVMGCGGAPDWVEDGSGVMNQENEEAIFGVGSVVGIQNEPLAWETAENRARAEIAKSVQTYTKYLMRDYAASTAGADFATSTERQNVERAVKTLTDVTLHGVRPIERYKDEENNVYYVLATVNLKEMKAEWGRHPELDERVKTYVQENSERVFRELEREITPVSSSSEMIE